MRVVEGAARRLKRLVRRYPGKLVAYRWRLVARRAHLLPALRRFEHAETARARAHFGGRPEASVAVIIATYRRPQQLLTAVASVLAQSVEDLVVIVVDDGGGLPPLPDDPRLYAYSLSRNCGVAGVVRNIGLRASASRWVAFLDDDNTWRADHVELALRAQRRGAELTYSALERRRRDGSLRDVLSVPFDRELLREHGIVDTSSLVIRRSKGVHFSRLPLRHGDFPLEDWELTYRLSRRLLVAHVDEPTTTYLVHPGSFFTDWARHD